METMSETEAMMKRIGRALVLWGLPLAIVLSGDGHSQTKKSEYSGIVSCIDRGSIATLDGLIEAFEESMSDESSFSKKEILTILRKVKSSVEKKAR